MSSLGLIDDELGDRGEGGNRKGDPVSVTSNKVSSARLAQPSSSSTALAKPDRDDALSPLRELPLLPRPLQNPHLLQTLPLVEDKKHFSSSPNTAALSPAGPGSSSVHQHHQQQSKSTVVLSSSSSIAFSGPAVPLQPSFPQPIQTPGVPSFQRSPPTPPPPPPPALAILRPSPIMPRQDLLQESHTPNPQSTYATRSSRPSSVAGVRISDTGPGSMGPPPGPGGGSLSHLSFGGSMLSSHGHGHSQLHPQSGSLSAQDGRQLNVADALNYLDDVKNRFQNQPNVYNQFLDIMKEFKSEKYVSFTTFSPPPSLFFFSFQ